MGIEQRYGGRRPPHITYIPKAEFNNKPESFFRADLSRRKKHEDSRNGDELSPEEVRNSAALAPNLAQHRTSDRPLTESPSAHTVPLDPTAEDLMRDGWVLVRQMPTRDVYRRRMHTELQTTLLMRMNGSEIEEAMLTGYAHGGFETTSIRRELGVTPSEKSIASVSAPPESPASGSER